MSKKIFIFDIDGTILPDVIKDNPNWDLSDNNLSIKKIVEESSRTELFPGFVDYFKSRCRHAEKVYFVTGRVKEYFLGLTVFQLIPIHKIGKNIEMIFYPLNQSFEEKVYLGWKLKIIKSIIKKHKNSIFYIYDDRCGYYDKIKKRENIILFNVEPGEYFWYNFIQQKRIKVKI